MKRKFISRNYYPSKKLGGFLLFIPIIVYFLENMLYKIDILSVYIQLIKAITVTIVTVLLLIVISKERILVKQNRKEDVIVLSVAFGIIYIIAYFALGKIDGFGESPYNFTPVGIITNLFITISIVIFNEHIKSKVLYNCGSESKIIIGFIISFLLAMVSFSILRYKNIDTLQELIKFASQYVLPEFALNLLGCYLIINGGVIPSIVYIGMVRSLEFILPIIPNLRWISKAFIGILLPMFFIMYIDYICPKYHRKISNYKREQNENPIGWILTSIVSIMIIWFAVGVFPYYPSVIASGSMYPMIKTGDVIIVKKVHPLDVDVGDVIQFQRNEIRVSHRIVEVVVKDNKKMYRTKGDNNASNDRVLIDPNDVRGKIAYVVPKVGIPTLIIKSKDSIDPSVLEF